jgi:hypothetical protein
MSGRIRVAPKEERTLDGITFASRAEMNRYAELSMLERAGLISELTRQPRFTLQEAYNLGYGERYRSLVYVADFSYHEKGNRRLVVEEVKGHITDVYALKKKLFRAKYPKIDFREVKV